MVCAFTHRLPVTDDDGYGKPNGCNRSERWRAVTPEPLCCACARVWCAARRYISDLPASLPPCLHLINSFFYNYSRLHHTSGNHWQAQSVEANHRRRVHNSRSGGASRRISLRDEELVPLPPGVCEEEEEERLYLHLETRGGGRSLPICDQTTLQTKIDHLTDT